MNEMRKLMESLEALENDVSKQKVTEAASPNATAYVIYVPKEGYYKSPGYYTDNPVLAKFYAKAANANKQKNAFYDSAKTVPILPKSAQILSVTIQVGKAVK